MIHDNRVLPDMMMEFLYTAVECECRQPICGPFSLNYKKIMNVKLMKHSLGNRVLMFCDFFPIPVSYFNLLLYQGPYSPKVFVKT